MTKVTPALIAAVRGPEEVEDAVSGGASVIEAREAGQLAAIRERLGPGGEILFRGRLAEEGAAILADRIALPVSAEEMPTLDRSSFGGARLVAVVPGGEDGAERLPGRLVAVGFTDVLVDLGGDGGSLSRIGLPKLRRLSDACRAAGLGLAFGGALEAPDVPRLRALGPDALLFDHALHRAGRLDRDAVAEIAALLRAEPLPGKGPSDRIFVRDLVVAMEVGAYDHERGRRQRVRFDVEVEVPRAGASAGMGGVYSYDLITDAVAMLAAGAHVDFVENLAEDLAGMVLADPRVRVVSIRVEKLDLGPGGVGIEIRRGR